MPVRQLLIALLLTAAMSHSQENQTQTPPEVVNKAIKNAGSSKQVTDKQLAEYWRLQAALLRLVMEMEKSCGGVAISLNSVGDPACSDRLAKVAE